MPTFDGDNLVITLDSGVTSIDVEVDLYSDWKEWMLLSDNAKYPPAFRTIGGDNLTPGIEAGAYFFLQNQDGWRIKPPEEDITIFVSGNFAPEDSDAETVVPTDGAYTAAIFGLQPITQKVDELLTVSQEASYNGAVFIDTIDGTPGAAYPCGLLSEPTSTLADGLTIANNLGLKKLLVRGTIVLTQDMSGFLFEGRGTPAVIILNGQTIAGCTFADVMITGDANSSTGVLVDRCLVSSVTNIGAGITESSLLGTNTLVVGTANDGFISNSGAHKTAGMAPIIDLQGAHQSVDIRAYVGALEIAGVSHVSATVEADIDVGVVTLAASDTAGTITIRGIGTLTDNSAGSTVNSDLLINNESIVAEGIIIRQGWSRQVDPTSEMRGIIHLESAGEAVTLPGGATCTFQAYDRAGASIAGYSGSGTLRTIGSDTFFDCSATYTPTAGEAITVRVTITGSGVGDSTHNGLTQIAFPEF